MEEVVVKVKINDFIINRSAKELIFGLKCLDGDLFIPNAIFKLISELKKTLDEETSLKQDCMELPFEMKIIKFLILYLYLKINNIEIDIPWQELIVTDFIEVINAAKFLCITDKSLVSLTEDILDYTLDFDLCTLFLKLKMDFDIYSSQEKNHEFYLNSRLPVALLERYEEVKAFKEHVWKTITRGLEDKSFKLFFQRNEDEKFIDATIIDPQGNLINISAYVEYKIIRDYLVKNYGLTDELFMTPKIYKTYGECWEKEEKQKRQVKYIVGNFMKDYGYKFPDDYEIFGSEDRDYLVQQLVRYYRYKFHGKSQL